MQLSDFDYFLPEELIAQTPSQKRDSSRMLVIDRKGREIADHRFSELPGFLREGDTLVLNNTKVFPARLYGQTDSGANVEIFLVKECPDGIWEVLARPGKRLRAGKNIVFSDNLNATVVERSPDGKIYLRFETDGDLFEQLDKVGRTPLPLYIKRPISSPDADRERYQTVYAKQRGSIAAPTAGLHFTPEILDKVGEKSVSIVEVTLHVGYGTFEPVRVDDLAEHKVSPEMFSIDEAAADALNTAKEEGRRIVAVGTTTTRALETSIARSGRFEAGKHTADITITPGYNFKAIDALLTNFHLPKSSLLVLTSTFGGHELIMRAYRHAVMERYRFYSYGDCMLIT